MMPTSKNFIFYDENRRVIPLPAEYYGEAMRRNMNGTETRLMLTDAQLNRLRQGMPLDDSSIVPLAKYGLVAESIYIPSTTRSVVTNNNDTMSHVNVEYHHKNAREPIRITLQLFARDFVDFSLKSSEYRAFLNNLGKFYVADARQPFKLYKVMINEPIEFTPPHFRVPVGVCELNLMKVDTIFGESLHTTQELDTEGVRFNYKWAYGMGLSSSEEQWGYSFSNENPRFYNAGTEEVKLIRQKDSEVRVNIRDSAAWIEIDDGETIFRLNRPVRSGDILRISGHEVTLNGQNVLGDTNGNFLTVKRGWNTWEVTNLSRYIFRIDFRYLYD